MKKLVRFTAILVILLTFTSVASAAKQVPQPFATTGYTTGAEQAMLQYPYLKFHLTNMGTVSGYFDGGFSFDEWGIVDLTTYNGANRGLMTITTAEGAANVGFSGTFDYQSVAGGFQFLSGTDSYKGIKGVGVKSGNAGYVFTVNYAPCGGKDQPACAPNSCIVFGDDLKLHKSKTQWKISNDGEQTLTISKILVFWPAGGPQLTKVKLAGKTIYDTPAAAPMAAIAAGWSGGVQDRQIGAGKQRDLWLEFGSDISAQPADYTILVEFAEGCAVPFVAFP